MIESCIGKREHGSSRVLGCVWNFKLNFPWSTRHPNNWRLIDFMSTRTKFFLSIVEPASIGGRNYLENDNRDKVRPFNPSRKSTNKLWEADKDFGSSAFASCFFRGGGLSKSLSPLGWVTPEITKLYKATTSSNSDILTPALTLTLPFVQSSLETSK